MFHRQSVCGLILGLTLVIFAGVFRPAEGITGKISDPEASKEVAIEIASGAESTEASQDGNAPGQSTSPKSLAFAFTKQISKQKF